MFISIVADVGELVARYQRLLLKNAVWYCSYTSRFAGGYNQLVWGGHSFSRSRSLWTCTSG